jgi:hypothetical protein
MGIVRNKSIYGIVISYIGILLGAIIILFLLPMYFTVEEFGLRRDRDRNLLLAEVRDCTISGPRNPVVVCFTSPLSSLTVI